MSKTFYSGLVIGNISLPFDTPDEDIIATAQKKLKSIGISSKSIELSISRKSVDARRKNNILYVSSVTAVCKDEGNISADEAMLSRIGAKPLEQPNIDIVFGDGKLKASPLIVGMGPAGLFSALLLAENGYRPIIIDRGGDIDDRAACVERFNRKRILDPECNIQYGAGGAGTFSDGKLMTRINDSRVAYVIRRLVEFGAPEDIKVKAKPHIGTDILRNVIKNILSRISELGGTVIYRCKYIGQTEHSDGSVTVHTTKGDFYAGALILALGNSSRDTFENLLSTGYDIIPKPISVGVRIEHLKEDIDKALYGDFAGHPMLGAGEYTLSDTTGERGVYTFCMCPGGTVVTAASEDGRVVVNGMSEHARSGNNSNCAIAVSVRCEDYVLRNGSAVLGAIDFQRNIERKAYIAGGSDYSVPVQTVGDFLEGVSVHEPSRIQPTYMNGGFKCTKLDSVLPGFVIKNLANGLKSFDKKLNGFACEDAVLSAAETRTSAPIRILRDEDMKAVGHKSVYPCGEGAGYAGGITSASVDGIRAAMAVMKCGKPNIN